MRYLLIVFCAGLTALSARGQFYAPQTDFHDLCQRRFPVEAARVLAWIRNRDSAGIADVTYQVETTPGHETVWSLEWRDKAQAVLRKATVRYGEDVLRSGPQWYRGVWKQLAGDEWALPKNGPGEFGGAFWAGAENAGLSRMEGVTTALQQITAAAPATAPESAQLAGTLVQAALPMVGTTVTLDGALLARAAAWLCAGEQRAGHEATSEWAPILALSGRDAGARAIWSATPPPQLSTANLRFWDTFIRLPPATEALSLISRPENRRYSAPLFFAYGGIDPAYSTLFIDVGQALYPGDRWSGLHDFGPMLNLSEYSRLPIGGDFPARSLQAWLKVLRALPPSVADVEGVQERARQAKDYDDGNMSLGAPSAELATLLNEGRHNDGPLVPVAVVTARDLLGFGWEFGGAQIGRMRATLSVLAGEYQTALVVEDDWFSVIEGWDVFTNTLKSPSFKPLEDTGRCEFIVMYFVGRSLIENPPAAWEKSPEKASAYFRRRWLMDMHRGLEFLVDHDGEQKLARDFLRRGIAEAGQRKLGPLLATNNTSSWTLSPQREKWEYRTAIDTLKLREELVQAVPMSTWGPRVLLDRKYADRPDPFAYAQALERLHWQSGIGFAPQTIFLSYVRANALESANRAYDAWHDAMANGYTFESTLGSANWALALLQNDTARIPRALADCGSTVDHIPEITSALLRDDYTDAQNHIDAWLARFPQGRGQGIYQKLRDYLVLVPALNDPNHADHQRALDEFPKSTPFLFLQWALSNRAHLSVKDAERFFGRGDDEGEGEAQLIVAALQKDRKKFEKLYQQFLGSRRAEDAKSVLCAWLRNEVEAIPPPKEQPDLRPPNARPLLPTLRAIAAEPGS